MVIAAMAQPPAVKYTPDPAQLSKLDVESTILGFAIRVPKHFEFTAIQDAPEGALSFASLGPQRSDKTRATIQLTFIKPPESEQKNFALGDAVTAFTNSIKSNRTSFVESPIQSGVINGIPYKHATWTGNHKEFKREMKGEFYIAKDRDMVIELACQDVGPGADSTLPLMDACMRTFRKVSQRLYYSMQWPDHSQIWSMDPNGANRVCLTPKSDTDYHPAVSPDGKKIAFTTHRTGIRSIWTMNADGSNQRAITSDADAGQCAWSPDGAKLVFSSNRDGKYCIYTMNSDGTNVKKISDGPSDDWPSWASNDTIVYEGMMNSIWTVMLANSDGVGKPKPLTSPRSHARWPNISPDGGYILYTAYVDDTGRQCHINLMKSDGSMKTPLTDGKSNEKQPSWTADGGQILFHSDRQGRYEVYVMESEKLQPRRVAEANMDTQEITTAGRAYSP